MHSNRSDDELRRVIGIDVGTGPLNGGDPRRSVGDTADAVGETGGDGDDGDDEESSVVKLSD